jgi:membrane fusion protein (multidrug efflux system)
MASKSIQIFYPKAFAFLPPSILSLVVAAFIIGGCSDSTKDAAAPQALEVSVVQAVKKDVAKQFEFVGQTAGAVDAEIRARVEGVLTGVHFEEGKEVKEGQLLYSIDQSPFLAKVAEAKAKVAEAQTRLVKADIDLKRIRPLADMNAVSKKDLDAAIAQQGVAKSAVDSANASLDLVNIELGYTKITAPVSGVIGLSKGKVGEFVGKAPNPVVLNTVSQLDPIHVRFAVNEKDYMYFARLKQKAIEAGNGSEKRVLELYLADGLQYPGRGEVTSADRSVDASTGSMAVEAAFPNPDKLLRPGQFAKIKVAGDTASGALLIPKRAIRDLQGQSQVFVVGPDNVVEQRTIVVGNEVAELQVVESGIADGERVAVDGLQRLRSGMKILPKAVS